MVFFPISFTEWKKIGTHIILDTTLVLVLRFKNEIIFSANYVRVIDSR